MNAGHRVTLVVAPGFGSAVRRIADERHVWAIRTPEYQRLADNDGRDSPEHVLERGITLFAAERSSPEDEVVAILATVEERHGEYSHDPPLDEVEVLGAEPTPEVREELAALEFTDISPTERGFVASRTL